MSPNKEHQWRNLLGCDHWVLAGTPRPKTVGFRNLVGVAIAPVSKKLAVKYKVSRRARNEIEAISTKSIAKLRT